MPMKPPSICRCGHITPAGTQCACQIQRQRERKARFDKTRPSARQRGYTAEWEKARKIYLRNNPACRMPNCTNPATVVDHIEPHKGNKRLFWNQANWQSLCTHCHSGRKQSMERRS